MDPVTEIKKYLKQKKIVIGTERTLENIKLGKVDSVFLSSNCPEKIVKDIERYGKISKINIIKLSQPNDELGSICKKPFPISVLSVLKSE